MDAPYTFDHYRLEGRSTVRIYNRPTDPHQGRRHYVWGNRSDTATLRNHNGRFINDAFWDHRHGSGHGHR